MSTALPNTRIRRSELSKAIVEQQVAGEAFESLLQDFKRDYTKNCATYAKRMEDVVVFLSDEKDGLRGCGIRHPPISYRLKAAESAADSIRRRQKERIDRRDLQNLVEKRGENWNEYCERWGEADKVDETKPVQTLEDIYKTIPDLAGVRVSLYLPGDVSRVKDFLERKTRTLVHVKTHHKTDNDPRVPGLQQRIADEKRHFEAKKRQQLHGDHNLPSDDVLDAPKPKTVFPGYSAYHIIVKVSRDHIINPVGTDERPGEDMLVEVQVATAVMHAWQGVEHDIVYKNLGSAPPSEDEIRLIDLFNGIILTGQLALEQLEATTKTRDMARVSRGEKPVRFPWELESIIAKHYHDHGRSIPNDARWNELNQLLGALEATGHQTVHHVQELLKEVEKDRPAETSIFDPHVPLRMLEELCKIQTRTIEGPGPSKVGKIWAEARFYALRVVHTLNMAIYLNIARDLIVSLRMRYDYPRGERPSPVDFLDILHPQYTSTNFKKYDRIITFCKWLLNYFSNPQLSKATSYNVGARIRLAGDFPKKSLIAWPKLPETMKSEMNPQNGAIVVPTWLLSLLYLAEPKRSVLLEKKSQGNTDATWDGQLDCSGSSVLEQLQAFFVPCPNPFVSGYMGDQESPGLWTIARGESLSPWEIKKVDFSDASPGFQTRVLDIPTKHSFQDLAERLNIDTTDLYQLVHEVRESVQSGNKKTTYLNQLVLEAKELQSGNKATNPSQRVYEMRRTHPLNKATNTWRPHSLQFG